jgi:hypothetical protein
MENFLNVEKESSFFKKISGEFNFNLDVFANIMTRKANLYMMESDDPLSRKWVNPRHQKTIVWCCPPNGRAYSKWARKCLVESTQNTNCTVVGLFPASTDTRWFRDYIHGRAQVRFIVGRFMHADTGKEARAAGMIVVWDQNIDNTIKTMDI